MYFRGGNDSVYGGLGSFQSWAKVWNDLNDGSGSGLDADLLDGVEATSFIRSDAADTKTSGNLSFSDDVKAVFGASNDLEIWHQSSNSNSIIKESGGGSLSIQSNGTYIDFWDHLNSNYMLIANIGGNVELYHNGNKKLETTSTGIAVTGNISVTGTVDGRDIATDGTKLDGIEALADVTDAANVEPLVDSHLNQSTAGTDEVLAWNGTDYEWIPDPRKTVISDITTTPNTIASGSSGKTFRLESGSGTVNINNANFAAGDTITIVNNTASDKTLTLDAWTAARIAGDATNVASSSITLAAYGVTTIVCTTSSEAYISGNVS